MVNMLEPRPECIMGQARCFNCEWRSAFDEEGSVFEQAYLHLKKYLHSCRDTMFQRLTMANILGNPSRSTLMVVE